METFIYEESNNLHPDVCKHIIEKFKRDKRTFDGMIGSRIVDKNIKDTKDLYLSSKFSDWKYVNEHLYSRLSSGLKNYVKHLEECVKSDNGEKININTTFHDIYDSRYTIHFYKEGGHYDWHHDDSNHVIRKLTCIWYLNTLDEDSGGCTEFQCGKKIKPEEGKLLIFPATWNYLHRGQKLLKGEKFIINTFILKDLVKV
jgi:hypothetical protein